MGWESAICSIAVPYCVVGLLTSFVVVVVAEVQGRKLSSNYYTYCSFVCR